MRTRAVSLAIVVVSACGAPDAADVQSQRLIYGADDRLEYYQAAASDRALADSTVALLANTRLTQRADGRWQIDTSRTFAASYNLCPSEPFREQPNPAYCSGFQVGADLIATAGHCIKTSSDCRGTRFVFGFRVDGPGAVRSVVEANDVYGCAAIVGRVQTSNEDWGLIRTSRPIAGHVALPIRRSGTVALGQALTVIGHPAGLPQKIDSGGTVRSNTASGFFEANLDTYGGNSGSAVFDRATGVVEGILVRGNADFVQQGSCNVSNVCPDTGCPGWEDATRVTTFASLVPGGAPASCGNGTCDTGESCDGRNGTTACAADCPGRTSGSPKRRYCYVGGTCEGPGCP